MDKDTCEDVWKWVTAKFGTNHKPDSTRLMRKVLEESCELVKELAKGRKEDAILELGDILVVLLQVGKHLGVTLDQAVKAKLPELWERLK